MMKLNQVPWIRLFVLIVVFALISACSAEQSSQLAEDRMVSSNESKMMREEAIHAPSESDMALPAISESRAAHSMNASPKSDRMLIYTANVTLETDNYAFAYGAIQDLIHLSGGYLVQFSEETTAQVQSGYFTLKVPAGSFNEFLKKLEKMPHLTFNRSMNAQDVSEEYVDLESRLKAKQVVEQRLLSFMEKAVGTDSLVRLSNELATVQENIEVLKGRMKYLEHHVAHSTVELRLYQQLKSSTLLGVSMPNVGERIVGTLTQSLNVMLSVVEGLIVFIAGLIPVVLLGGLISVPIYRVVRRRVKQAKQVDE
jgi:hypothetical protein